MKPKTQRDEFPKTGDPKRIPSPAPLPDRDTFKSRKKLLLYLAQFGSWVLENFGDEVRKFAAEEKKGR